MIELEEFITRHKDEMKKGIMTEACISDMFDMILEMSASDRRAINSQSIRLYTHLLKYQYQQDHQTRSWINTIRNSSLELRTYKDTLPSIWRSVTLEDKLRDYQNGINEASKETGIDKRLFPKEMPAEFEFDNVITEKFIESYLVNYAYTNEAKKVLRL